jgi:signal transduction histidine kinase
MNKKAALPAETDVPALNARIEGLQRANAELRELLQTEKLASSGRIARTIAHEVRNPLTNMLLAADQVRSDLGSTIHPETALMLEMIHRNGQRINGLITDLLNSTESPHLEYQRIPLHTLLDRAVAAAQDRIQLKELRVVKEYAPGNGDVLVDAEKMQVAFLNLIINAVEAMEPGRGTLRLHTEPKDRYWLVSITDNGTGIEAEALPKLFEPYFSRKPNGTGLGLTHTYTIISTHKGAIAVESTPGRGTTFRVTLPAAG